jgi:predicted regulator of Ras-like GTPase activity (Roadblock/LC7/MglB family)
MPAGPQPDGSELGRLLAETRRLCPEIQAAVLTGPDGLVLERFVLSQEGGGLDPELLAAESGGALGHLQAFAAAANLGRSEEWSLRTEGASVIGRAISGTDLWLLLLASDVAWQGRLRFAARVTAGRLAPLLAGGGA